MTPKEFLALFREYFGPRALMPVALCYSDTPLAQTGKSLGCMFKSFNFESEIITYSANTLTCGGGKFYAGMTPMPPYVCKFVSEKEKYKITPELAGETIGQIAAMPAPKPYINFIPLHMLERWDGNEGVIFFANPDILAGLFVWANYDQADKDAVQAPFGSGCSATITAIVNENKKRGGHCFIGLLDISARPYFPADVLSFAIPMCRFIAMLATFSQCAVAGAPAWKALRSRIDSQ